MMKTRILALILLMALIFPVMATNPTTTEPPKPLLPLLCQMLGLSDILEALNLCPGSSQQCPCNKKTPNDPKCINMQIPFGRPVNRPEIPSGTILLQAEKPTASLFTPQSLAFDFEFNSYIVDAPSTHDKGQGNTSYTYVDVTVARPNGQGITYRFNLDALTANDRYSGLPIGKDVAMNSKMRYIAPETNHPAYYERLSPTGYKARFPADNYLMAKPTIITPQGQELTWNSQDVQVEPIYRDNALRQIWSAADGLADFVVIDDYKYEIRLYAPENAGSKNGQGLYVPQNSPVELWTVENPNRSDTNFNNVRISQTIAGTTYVYDWTYTEGTDAWTVTSGAGLRTASKHYFGDFKTTDCQIIEETRDAANNVVSKKVSNSHKFDWGPAIVDETLDPDGANLKTSYTYYMTSSETGRYGRMKTLLKPDGSWESYDYDSTGRPTLVVSSYLDAAFDSAANSAKAVYYSYTSLDTADELLENDGRARTVETKILGITVNKKYFVYKTVNGEAIEIKEEGIAAFGDSTNQRKTTVYYAGTSRIKSITWTDGKLDSYSYEYGTYSANPDPASCSFTAGTGDALRQIVIHGTSANPAGVAGKSTKETKVTDGRNNNVMTETYAYDGAGYSRVAWNVDTFDAQHHVLASYNSDGTYSTATWNCCSKDSETTSDGTQYNYSYNLLKQMVSKTKVDGPSTAYICDAEDRLLSVTVSGGGTSLSSFAIHDLAGRVTSTTDVAGLVTTYAYSNGDRTISITHPGGFTESKDLYLDGRIKSLVGTALVPKYYTYGVNQDGTLWTKIYTASENGPNYVKTTVDALGRTVSEERPGYNGAIATNYFYNSQGLLVKKTSTNQVDTLYAYDGFNNQIQTVLDLNANGQIDLASDDRISESETSYQSDSGQWWSVATSKVYGDNGSVTTGTTKNRLTGLGNGLISETHSIDINGNDTVSTTTLDRTNKTLVKTTVTPDSNVAVVSTTVNDLLVSQRTKENLTYVFSYDGIERQIGRTDPRTGQSITHYNNKNQIDYVQDAVGKQTSFNYESDTGRRASVVSTLSKSTNYTYNSRGQIVSVRGNASYPLDYVYDSYGRMVQLKTFRSTESIPSTPDITTWTYQDAAGLLTSKTYADNNSVSYTYTVDGKLATRIWSRGVVTTYGYNLAGDLTGIDYSDTTPDVGFTYNRLGQQLTVTDAVGSRTFEYSDKFRLTSETINGIYNKVISRSYDTLGRSSGMNIGTEYAVGYGYDNLGRFSTVTSGSDVFTYGYLPNSNLIQSITYPSSITSTKSYESNRDLVTGIENKYGTTTISKYDYSNDDLGRRTAIGKSGTAFSQADTIAYGYNDKSEVTSAVAQNQATYNYGFNFDAEGNRTTSVSTETGTSLTRNYTSNNLNQYTIIDNPTAAPTYDFDGNMLNDGTWAFTWNGENRIITATQGTTVVSYLYDYFGRRVERKVTEGGTVSSHIRYVYEQGSFNKIEELNVIDSNVLIKKYVWGLDIVGSQTKTGSVGALLAQIDGIGTSYAVCDANGNVSDYLDASDNIEGHLEYSPFGKVSAKNGNRPDDFSFRFSTKYEDAQTGDLDYGYRDYDSQLGRWRSREPLEELAHKSIKSLLKKNILAESTIRINKNYKLKDRVFVIREISDVLIPSYIYASCKNEMPEYLFCINSSPNIYDINGEEIPTSQIIFQVSSAIAVIAVRITLDVLKTGLDVESQVTSDNPAYIKTVASYWMDLALLGLLQPGQEVFSEYWKDCDGVLHHRFVIFNSNPISITQ